MIAPASSKESGDVPQDAGGKSRMEDGLDLPSYGSGAGILSKLVFFGVIVGVIAIIMKSRKSRSGRLSEKSLA